MIPYFEDLIEVVKDSLESIDENTYEKLVSSCVETLKRGNKIVVSGLGKNVPVCDKFVGTMLSLGLNAGFMHTNSAFHGDLGMVHDGDLVIILTKSGSTAESIALYNVLALRNVELWLLTFSKDGKLSKVMDNILLVHLEHEGDIWNIIPNNSTTLNLIILQAIAIEISKRMGVSLQQFKMNHPGGAIGEALKNV